MITTLISPPRHPLLQLSLQPNLQNHDERYPPIDLPFLNILVNPYRHVEQSRREGRSKLFDVPLIKSLH